MSVAIGMIEVEGVAGIILASDAACKTAGVDLLGWESIGGFTTVFFGGSISKVATALKCGEEAAREVVEPRGGGADDTTRTHLSGLRPRMPPRRSGEHRPAHWV